MLLGLFITTGLLAGCSALGYKKVEPTLSTPDVVEEKISKLDHTTARQIFSSYLGAILAESRGDISIAANMYLKAMRADVNNLWVRDRAFSLLLATGDYIGAVEVAKIVADQEDRIPLVDMLLTFDSAITGNYDESLKYLKKIRSVSPDLIQFELIEHYINLAKGQPIEEIVTKLDTFEAGAGLIVYKYYHLGRLYERKGDITAAIATYRKGHMLDPNALFIVTRLGKLLEAENEIEQARNLYQSFLALHPNSLLVDIALQHLESGKKVALEPQNLENDLAEVMFGLASVMMGQQINLTARQFLHLALMAQPEHSFAIFTLGLIEEQDNNYQQALTHYKKLSAKSLPYLAAQVRMAEVLQSQDKHREAIVLLNKLMASNPDASVIRESLAQIYFDLKSYKKAARQYSSLINSLKNNYSRHHANLFFARGATYERLKDYDKATHDLQKALDLEPNNPIILNYLGYMWIDQGQNVDQGYEYIKRAVQLRPNDAAIVDSLGWVYFKRGKLDAAVYYLERAVSLMPDDSTINMHLGDAYHSSGRKKEAKIQWQRALQLTPDSKEDEARLKELIDGK